MDARTSAFLEGTRLLGSEEHCRRAEIALDGIGAEWEAHMATPELGRHLPHAPGLYMFVWRPPFRARLGSGGMASFRRVLYVGRAGGPGSGNTLRGRYRGYTALLADGAAEADWPKARDRRLAALFRLRHLRYWCAPVSDETALPDMEKRLIELFDPPGNHERPKPQLQVLRTRPAF